MFEALNPEAGWRVYSRTPGSLPHRRPSAPNPPGLTALKRQPRGSGFRFSSSFRMSRSERAFDISFLIYTKSCDTKFGTMLPKLLGKEKPP